MSTVDSGQNVWARLRSICRDGYRLPPVSEEQARDLERNHCISLPADECHDFTRVANGIMRRSKTVCYLPATEEQLGMTEERLGFPLPADLRRLYSEVANGGFHLGPVKVFHGAVGGCGEYANYEPGGRAIEELVSHSGWRFHPRVEEALLRNPRYHIIVDSAPEGFLEIGADHPYSIMLDPQTGYIYHFEYWGEIPNAPDDGAMSVNLYTIDVVAPSLAVWFEQWLDQTGWRPYGGHLAPEMIETDDLPDPDIVWRGLYRFGPDWEPRPADEEDLYSLSPFLLKG